MRIRSRLDPSGISVCGETGVLLSTAVLKPLRTEGQSRSLSNAWRKEVRWRHNKAYTLNRHRECYVNSWKEEDTCCPLPQILRLDTQGFHVGLEARWTCNQLERYTASGSRTQTETVRGWTQERMIEMNFGSTPYQWQELSGFLENANRRSVWGRLFQRLSMSLENSGASILEQVMRGEV